MGMTIEESLNNLIELQKDYQQFHDDVWQDPKAYSITAESLRIGIETMCKYQKIQEVMDSRPDDSAKSNSKALGEIEMIMYGNDWNKIDLHIIEQKKKKIVSTKDALKDIIPYLIEEGSMDDGKID